MFRDMRRKNQLLNVEESEEILKLGKVGVLAVSGDNDYPYTVPLNYVYNNGKIYFHCAKSGHKIDSIQKNSRVSMCIINKDEIIPEKFTTYFRSVIVFGNAKILTKDTEIRHAMELIIKKYSTNYEKEGNDEIKRYWDALCVIEISIEHMTGKQAIDLVNMK